MKKVLILSSAESKYNRIKNDNFLTQIKELSNGEYAPEWHNLADVSFTWSNGSIEAFLLPDNISIDNFDFVYFKSFYRYVEVAVSLAEYLRSKSIQYACSELDTYISFSKMSQYIRASFNNLPMPDTVFISKKHLSNYFDSIQQAVGIPFIMKAIDGKGGDLNYLIKNEEEFKEAIKESGEAEMIIQSFVANSGDMRLLVLDYEVQLIILRQRKDDSTHLNNTSQGANAHLIKVTDVDPKVVELSLKAAHMMKREVCGVDIMLEIGTNKPFFLEINPSPQVVTGAFNKEKVAVFDEYFKKVTKNIEKN